MSSRRFDGQHAGLSQAAQVSAGGWGGQVGFVGKDRRGEGSSIRQRHEDPGACWMREQRPNLCDVGVADWCGLGHARAG
jgi:hypothetical protein